MSTEAQLKAISNSELASGNQIPALKHRTVNNAIIEEMYDAQSRADVLAGVQTAVSISSGDQVLVIRSGQAYLLDSSEFGFVDALADLTDVSIPTPANDQVLAYNTTTSKWEAKDVNTLTSVVSISGTATTNALTKFTGTSSIGNSIISDNGTTVTIGGNLNVDNNLTVGTINSGTSSDFVKGDGSLDSTTYQDTSEKGQANGYTPLDSGAKVAEAYLPDSILGQVSYQGTWAASTNTPTLANPPASTTKGEYYVSSDDGTQFGIDFKTGDWIISNGTAWEKVDNTDAVTSVFGRLGNVVPNKIDYISFYVSLDTSQTITGEKTFTNTGSANTVVINHTSGSAGIALDITKSANGEGLKVNKTSGTGNAATIIGTLEATDLVGGSATITGNLAVDTNTLLVDSTNNRVGIGTSSPAVKMQVVGSGSIFRISDDVSASGTLDLKATSSAATINANTYSAAVPLTFEIASSEKMRIDSSGNVGIGTSSPSVKLEVSGSVKLSDSLFIEGVTPRLYLTPSSTTGFSEIRFGDSTDTDSGEIQYSNADDSMAFRTAASERMRIDSSGNVGIGTSSPNAQLQLTGDIWTGVGTAADPSVKVGDGNTGLYYVGGNVLGVTTNGTERMRIDSSGNVGIGTTTVGQFFSTDVGLTVDSGNVYSGIALTDGNTTGVLSQGYSTTYLYNKTNGNMLFGTNNTERMRITSSGNVGIGTSSPSADLVVSNSGAEGIEMAGYNASVGGSLVQSYNRSTSAFTRLSLVGNNLDFRTGTSPSTKMSIDSSGNVGIGTSSPSDKLTVSASAASAQRLALFTNSQLGSSFSAGAFITLGRSDLNRSIDIGIYGNGSNEFDGKVIVNETGGSLILGTSATERMRIDSSGNVLVGKTVAGIANQGVQLIGGGQSGFTAPNGVEALFINHLSPSGTQTAIQFRYGSSGSTAVGSITTTSTTTFYNTSSDYRLKENVVPMEGALDRVDALKPSRFNFISDPEKTVDGFLAHEAAEVVPEAVTGEKDAVDEEGNPQYQGIDQSKLVPLLVGAIKELKEMITNQQAEIETLKQQING